MIDDSIRQSTFDRCPKVGVGALLQGPSSCRSGRRTAPGPPRPTPTPTPPTSRTSPSWAAGPAAPPRSGAWAPSGGTRCRWAGRGAGSTGSFSEVLGLPGSVSKDVSQGKISRPALAERSENQREISLFVPPHDSSKRVPAGRVYIGRGLYWSLPTARKTKWKIPEGGHSKTNGRCS